MTEQMKAAIAELRTRVGRLEDTLAERMCPIWESIAAVEWEVRAEECEEWASYKAAKGAENPEHYRCAIEGVFNGTPPPHPPDPEKVA